MKKPILLPTKDKSDDVEEAARTFATNEVNSEDFFVVRTAFKAGVQWQKERSYSWDEVNRFLWAFRVLKGREGELADFIIKNLTKGR